MYPSQTVWSSHPSQWMNLNAFASAAGCLLLFSVLEAHDVLDAAFRLPGLSGFRPLLKTVLFLLPITFAVWRWLEVRFHVYELTEEVFREHSGVLNRVSQELELYRVNDTMVLKPFELNVMGLGNVVLHTTDASTPVVIIRAIEQPDRLREMLRSLVEQQRTRRGIVEIGNR